MKKVIKKKTKAPPKCSHIIDPELGYFACSKEKGTCPPHSYCGEFHECNDRCYSEEYELYYCGKPNVRYTVWWEDIDDH